MKPIYLTLAMVVLLCPRASAVTIEVNSLAALQAAGLEVRVISGGLRPAVLGLARHLGVPADAVAAVPVHFDDDGVYALGHPVRLTQGGDEKAHALLERHVDPLDHALLVFPRRFLDQRIHTDGFIGEAAHQLRRHDDGGPGLDSRLQWRGAGACAARGHRAPRIASRP